MPKTISLPPPNLTLLLVHWGKYCSLGLRRTNLLPSQPNRLNSDSTLKRTQSQFSSVHMTCSEANFYRLILFVIEMKGFVTDFFAMFIMYEQVKSRGNLVKYPISYSYPNIFLTIQNNYQILRIYIIVPFLIIYFFYVYIIILFYVYIIILIHIYPTPPLGQDMTQGQFLSGVQPVWIQSFPSSRLVASPRLKNLVCPTIYPWRENNWIHTFPKGISAMWNAISLVQDLNSCRHVHFLRR